MAVEGEGEGAIADITELMAQRRLIELGIVEEGTTHFPLTEKFVFFADDFAERILKNPENEEQIQLALDSVRIIKKVDAYVYSRDSELAKFYRGYEQRMHVECIRQFCGDKLTPDDDIELFARIVQKLEDAGIYLGDRTHGIPRRYRMVSKRGK